MLFFYGPSGLPLSYREKREDARSIAETVSLSAFRRTAALCDICDRDFRHFCFCFLASSLVLIILGMTTGVLYGEMLVGTNMPTLRRYSPYSGYLPDVMTSVSQVDPWNSRTKNDGPTASQLYKFFDAKQDH